MLLALLMGPAVKPASAGTELAVMMGLGGVEWQVMLMRSLTSKPLQETLLSSLGWPPCRSGAYGTVQAWPAPYFAAVGEALTQALPRPHVVHWAEVERALTGAFRDIVYGGQPVHPTLERYHQQLQQARQRAE